MKENSYISTIGHWSMTNQNITNATSENTDEEIIGKCAGEETGKLKPVDKKKGPESQALLQLEAGSRCISEPEFILGGVLNSFFAARDQE